MRFLDQLTRIVVMTGMLLGASGERAFAQETAPSPKVSIAAAYTDDLIDQVIFIGRGEAINKVEIVARVSGFVEEIVVNDGDDVNEGDILSRLSQTLTRQRWRLEKQTRPKLMRTWPCQSLNLNAKQNYSDADLGQSQIVMSPWPIIKWRKRKFKSQKPPFLWRNWM